MIELHYTGCQRPILRSLLDHLWTPGTSEIPDLSNTALLLPTRNVGRRVRESLALRALEEGRALLSPTVLTPGSLFSAMGGGAAGLSRADQTLVVARALRSASSEMLNAAFGRDPEGGLEEQLSFARFFLETRRELSEALLDFREACELETIGDRDRWRALAGIEHLYSRLLDENGQQDPDDRAAQIAKNPTEFFPWKRMVIAGTPDFPERVAVCLRNLGTQFPIEILVLADPDQADGFDEVGRPRVEWFSAAPIEIPDESLIVCKDVGEANGKIADRLSQHPESRSACVCGVGFPADGAALTFELQTKGISAYDPAGQPFGSTEAGRFFRHLTGVCFGEEIPDLVAWLRDPFVARWMKSAGERASREDWIQEADELLEKILPNAIGDFFNVVANRKRRSRVLSMTRALRRTARETGNIFALVEHPDLRPLLAEVETSEGVPEFASALAAIHESAGRLAGIRDLYSLGRWAVEEAMKFPVYADRPAEVIEVLGWLELLWEENEWLQIPDFYDGSVPGMIGSHPLLPETLRQNLHIPGRKTRDARDAYILRTLIDLRSQNGRVDLHVPGRDLEGSVVSPSRLLYYTKPDALPHRVQWLSQEPTPTAPASSASPITINPSSPEVIADWLDSLDRIHVTSFSSWVRCPFTFFLERVANWKCVDPDRLEMDPGAFGTGLHEVMRQLDEPESEPLNWEGLEAVEARAYTLLDNWFIDEFGRRPGLLLELQREGLKRRVQAAVKIRQESRLEGWTPLHVEWNFRDEQLLTIEGIPISGQIDLVEERGDELRVVDYKTSEKATDPLDAHITDLSRRRSFSVSSLLPVSGLSQWGWTNLQLPLYAAALRKKYPGRPIRVAYIQLPRAVTESKLVEWPEFTDDLAQDGFSTAQKVVAFWRQKGFWPPSSTFKQSDQFEWSGPNGEASWTPEGLVDLASLESGNQEDSE
ncbi:PD-(D/E)XK nuclease family protein [Puniceicoccus vermicola]|uniref:PD-(D/E)XK nuclease family protein n=1 Tax=Puniceicoccus vermicola TaxID=388746 RepID=A0A7X1AXQ0_9BACT|nr:PD-(D/E)XK nuclease family protein [Puniceicoccus vermicola]